MDLVVIDYYKILILAGLLTAQGLGIIGGFIGGFSFYAAILQLGSKLSDDGDGTKDNTDDTGNNCNENTQNTAD